MSIVVSFALLAGLYAILFRVCVNIVIPVAKTNHELYHFARQVGKEAAQEGRKMNDYDEYCASLEQTVFYNDGNIVSGPKTIMTHAERQEFHKSSPLFRKFYQ